MTLIPQRRKEDRVPGRVRGFFGRFFMIVGVCATIVVVMLVMTLSRAAHYRPPDLPDKMVLVYKLKDDLAETIGKPTLTQPLLRPATTLHKVTRALEAAALDDRVKGLVVKLENMNLSLAQVQELRNAVFAFRAGGKFAWIFSEHYGRTGMSNYYLATAFDQIWVQPTGGVALQGLNIEMPFFKGLFDKVGIAAEFEHQGKYKSAPESFTLKKMSKPNREMIESLAQDLSGQVIDGIAHARKMKSKKLRALMDRALFSTEDALKEKLVDVAGYEDEMVEAVRKTADVDKKGMIKLGGYAFLADPAVKRHGMAGFVSKLVRDTAPPTTYQNNAKIALIYGVGDIISYGSTSSAMPADKLVQAFNDALNDPDVVAVVFRVDSPGGSPDAAESIRRAVIRTQEKGRPVIVSMGTSAASGGYWVSANAKKIVAQPATLTGSIGVFGGKFVGQKLSQKLGVTWDVVSVGKHARMWSPIKPFSKTERKKYRNMMGDIYNNFLTRVAEGRGLDEKAVRRLAQGRVYTGQQALNVGLVDALGGLDTAIRMARTEAGYAGFPVPVIQFPPQKTTLEMFMSLAFEGSDAGAWLPDVTLKDILSVVEAVPRDHMTRQPDILVR